MFRIFLATALLCGASTATAQSVQDVNGVNLIPGLDVEASMGFGDMVGSNEPAAVTVFVRNNTRETIQGQFQLADRWQSRRMNLEEVYLAPGQARRYCWIRKFENWGSPELQLAQGRKIVWQRQLSWGGYNRSPEGHHRIGIVHDGTQEHQFRIDLPPVQSQQFETGRSFSMSQKQIEFTEAGYQLLVANVRTWQIPDHFGALEPLRAIIVLDSVDSAAWNGAQLEAVAKWVSTGGALYLPVQSTELLQKIERALPFALSPAVNAGSLAIRKTGQGQIILYADPLFGESTLAAEEVIYRSVAALPVIASRDSIDLEILLRQASYGRNATRVSLMGYFFGYLVLCAVPIVFVTSRLKRRVVPYTVGLVACGCLAAAVVGATLRNSSGEARLLTLTVPGENGTVQYADIEARSTGGISSTVRVTGKDPDLQAESPTVRYHYYYGNRNRFGMAFEGFDYQPNEVSSENEYQIQSEITPWGTRRLRATDFTSEVRPPEVKIVVERNAAGRVTLGSCEWACDDQRVVRNVALQVQYTPIGSANTYDSATLSLPDFSVGSKRKQSILFATTNAVEPIVVGDQVEKFQISLEPTPGTARAFLVGTLEASPLMQFDNKASDFNLDHSAHLWFYEVPLDQITVQDSGR